MSEQTEVEKSPKEADLEKQLNSVTSERDNIQAKLRELQKTAQNATTLKTQLDEMLVKHSNLASEYEGFKTQVKQQEVDRHVSTALEAAGAKNPATVRKLLDLSKIQYGEDGLPVQDSISQMLSQVKESDPYLFKEAEEDPKKGNSTPGTGGNSAVDVKPAKDGTSKKGLEFDIQALARNKNAFAEIEKKLQAHLQGVK